MSRYLFSFAVITTLLAVAFTIKRIDSAIFFDKPTPKSVEITSEEVDLKNNITLKDLEKDSVKRNFIADEYHLKWDLVDPEFTKIRVFVLTYDNLDKFENSCVHQVLDDFNLTRKSKNKGEKFFIKIDIKEQSIAYKIQKLLNSYDINGSIKELSQFKDQTSEK